MLRLNLHLFLLLAFLAIKLNLASEEHWGYPDLENGEAYQRWGGVCDTGLRQSPINLSQMSSLKGIYSKLRFDNYEDEHKSVTMVNNGHTIQLSGFVFEMGLKGGPLLDDYVVEQIHLHWWSEHTIDNIRYPLEAHIVHRNKRYENMTEAGIYKDGISVVSVLYHVSNEPNAAIEEIVQNLDAVKSASNLNKPIIMNQPFVVRDLFPNIIGYITYLGSLTTPDCSEAVTWIVLTETFPVTMEQVDKFKEVEYEEGKPLTNNYRNIQQQHNRAMIVVFSDDSINRNAATSLRLSLGVILLTAIFTKFLL